MDVQESRGKENLENPDGFIVMKKYNGDQSGLPFWLILDANGTMLANSELKADGATEAKPQDNVGCSASEKDVSYFISILKATSELSDDDLDVIHKRFLLNQPVPQAAKAGTK